MNTIKLNLHWLIYIDWSDHKSNNMIIQLIWNNIKNRYIKTRLNSIKIEGDSLTKLCYDNFYRINFKSRLDEESS